MRTVTYKSVIDRIASYLAEFDGLSTEDAGIANAKVNFFTRLGWKHYWWPETMNVEQRTFRAAWNSVTTYAATNEVFDPPSGQYLQALQGSTNQPPTTLQSPGCYQANAPFWAWSCPEYSADDWATGIAYVSEEPAPSQVRNPGDGLFYQCIVDHTSGGSFDPTKFAVLTPFVRSLNYAQTGQTAFGLVRFIWDRDPETHRSACQQQFRMRNSFIQVLGCVNVVWVEYQVQVPEFTNVIYNSTLSYGTNVTLYDPKTGNCWTTLEPISPGEDPTSAPSAWQLVPMPYFLAEYVAQSAYAMMTDREQETPENFTIENAAGYPLLLAELDDIERKQGQTRQLNVRSGRGGVAMTPYVW